MQNEEIGNKYLKWFADNYQLLKNKYRKFCQEKDYDWDEDVFSDTYMKIYETILKKGLLDCTEKGFDAYTFMSFRQNIQRERQYCRVSKRDLNIKNEDINKLYEEWYNEHQVSSINKVKKDLYTDFTVLYIMKKVEENFDKEHFHLFQLKNLVPNMTYKELAKKVKSKGVRQKVIDVKNWVKENITKQEIDKAFTLMYGDLL